MKKVNELKGDSAVRDIQTMPNTPGHLYAAHVMHDLWRITEGKALVVTDVGQHQMWEAQYYKHDFPRKLITSGGLGTMGFALPAAIGAKFASPKEEVWVIVGDGGFQMTAAELSTCAQEGIKVNVAVINNGFLGMVRQWQQFFYGGRYAATPLRGPDFVKLAEAHGLLGLRVTERSRARRRRRAGPRRRGHGRHRLPRRARRQRLPHGAGRGRPPRHDPPAEPHRRNCPGRVTERTGREGGKGERRRNKSSKACGKRRRSGDPPRTPSSPSLSFSPCFFSLPATTDQNSRTSHRRNES